MNNDGQGKYALNNQVYDAAKDATTIYIPALVTLYVALAAIWHWGYVVEVAGTGAAIVTFLGVILKISTTSYNNSLEKGKDGTFVVDFSDPTKDVVVADVTTPFVDVQGKKNIVLRVVDKTTVSQ